MIKKAIPIFLSLMLAASVISPVCAEDSFDNASDTLMPEVEGATALGTDGTAFGKGAEKWVLENAIAAMTSDADPEGTVYHDLRLRTKKVKRNSIKVVWQKVSGAKKYVIYANKAGKKNTLKRVKTTTKTSYTLKKINGKNLKKGTYYKLMAAALDADDKVITTSKIVFAATKGGKAGNDKSVSVASKTKKKVNTVTLKVGKTYQLTVKTRKESGVQKVKRYRKIKYESSDTGIATVTAKGKIQAVKEGKCYAYAYAQNGLYSRVKVTVVK